jgi:hypothetical protein
MKISLIAFSMILALASPVSAASRDAGHGGGYGHQGHISSFHGGEERRDGDIHRGERHREGGIWCPQLGNYVGFCPPYEY